MNVFTKTSHRVSRRVRLGAVATTAVLLVTACGGGNNSGGGGDDSGEGVPAGSGAAEYKKAFADLDDTKILHIGHVTGKGHPSITAYEEYWDIVDEWSGGKVKGEVDYGGAQVPIVESLDALKEGRGDVGLLPYGLGPDTFPVANLLSDLTYLGDSGMYGATIARIAANAEFAMRFDPVWDEAEKNGVVPLSPSLLLLTNTRLGCKDKSVGSQADTNGVEVTAANGSMARAAESVGLTLSAVSRLEVFEGLERGVVDCTIWDPNTQNVAGWMDLFNTISYGDTQDFPAGISGIGASKVAWDKYPLVLKQLLWDTQVDMASNQLEALVNEDYKAVVAAQDKGIEFVEYDDAFQTTLTEHYATERTKVAKTLEDKGWADDGDAAIAELEALHEKWEKIVTEELGFPNVSFGDLTEEVSADEMENLELRPVFERLYEEIDGLRRPK